METSEDTSLPPMAASRESQALFCGAISRVEASWLTRLGDIDRTDMVAQTIIVLERPLLTGVLPACGVLAGCPHMPRCACPSGSRHCEQAHHPRPRLPTSTHERLGNPFMLSWALRTQRETV